LSVAGFVSTATSVSAVTVSATAIPSAPAICSTICRAGQLSARADGGTVLNGSALSYLYGDGSNGNPQLCQLPNQLGRGSAHFCEHTSTGSAGSWRLVAGQCWQICDGSTWRCSGSPWW